MANHADRSESPRQYESPGAGGQGMIRDMKSFIKGIALGVAFLIVLFIMFMPIFGHGENALRAADRLFNSISKDSSNFIPSLLKKNQPYMGKTFDVTITAKDQAAVEKSTKLLTTGGAKANSEGTQLKVSGDLGQIVAAALNDSSALYHGKGAELQAKYGVPGREVVFLWWNIFKGMDKDLTKQKKFQDAAYLQGIVKKGLEVSYNYFQIEPRSAASEAGILAFSLVFYVIYTLWWGIAVLFIFEGLGLEMKAGAKKEM
jgi:hypothetical protein